MRKSRYNFSPSVVEIRDALQRVDDADAPLCVLTETFSGLEMPVKVLFVRSGLTEPTLELFEPVMRAEEVRDYLMGVFNKLEDSVNVVDDIETMREFADKFFARLLED